MFIKTSTFSLSHIIVLHFFLIKWNFRSSRFPDSSINTQLQWLKQTCLKIWLARLTPCFSWGFQVKAKHCFSQKQCYYWRLNWAWTSQKFIWHHCNAFPIVLWAISPMRKFTSSFSFIFYLFGWCFIIANAALKHCTLPWVEFSVQRCSNTQLLKDLW